MQLLEKKRRQTNKLKPGLFLVHTTHASSQEHWEVNDKIINTAHRVVPLGHHTDLVWSCSKFLYIHRCYGSKCDYDDLLLINCRHYNEQDGYLGKGGKVGNTTEHKKSTKKISWNTVSKSSATQDTFCLKLAGKRAHIKNYIICISWS